MAEEAAAVRGDRVAVYRGQDGDLLGRETVDRITRFQVPFRTTTLHYNFEKKNI